MSFTTLLAAGAKLRASVLAALITEVRPVFARKPADEQITNNTLQNDDHLALAVAANTVYALSGWLVVNSTSEAPDFKVAFTFPTDAVISYSARGLIASASGTTAAAIETVAKMDQTSPSASIASGVVNDTHSIRIDGLLVVGSTAGTLQLQWAQANTNATATTVKKNSWIRLDQVE
jgi:hypothetical protein